MENLEEGLLGAHTLGAYDMCSDMERCKNQV